MATTGRRDPDRSSIIEVLRPKLAGALVVVVAAVVFGVALRTTTAASAVARVWAAGDLAKCSNGAPASRAAADIVASDPQRPFLALGDLAYPNGSASDFANCYNPVWGNKPGGDQLKDRTRPAPGNHEYRTAGAAGYLGYFAPITTWYAWELNGWQLLSLDSNCSFNGGCGPGSPEYTWLELQLRNNPRACQVAYWHHPRWSQGPHGNEYAVGPLYQLLVSYGVELLLTGHDHIYQRYAALDANKTPSPGGVVEIVVGTGGAERESGSTTNSPAPLVRNDTTFGALSLELDVSSWRSTFVPEAGRTFTDSATGTCHVGPLTPTTTTGATTTGGTTTTSSSTTSTSTTSTSTTSTVPPTTTTVATSEQNDLWAFWGYVYSDAKRQSNGTYRWDQAPYRYPESAARFQRGAAIAEIGLRQDAAGVWYTTVPIATIPRPPDPAAIGPYLAASIEGEAICSGMVFDNFTLSMVQYIAQLYAEVGVPTTLRTYSGGFNELFVASTYWPTLNTWPYATTVRTPGAPNCTLTSK